MRFRADMTTSVTDLIRAAYAKDEQCVALLRSLRSDESKDLYIVLSARLRARLHRYSIDQGQLCYSTDVENSLVSLYIVMMS